MDKLGIAAGDPVGMFTRATVEELHARKDEYRKHTNSNGEVPTLRLASGDVVQHSPYLQESVQLFLAADVQSP